MRIVTSSHSGISHYADVIVNRASCLSGPTPAGAAQPSAPSQADSTDAPSPGGRDKSRTFKFTSPGNHGLFCCSGVKVQVIFLSPRMQAVYVRLAKDTGRFSTSTHCNRAGRCQTHLCIWSLGVTPLQLFQKVMRLLFGILPFQSSTLISAPTLLCRPQDPPPVESHTRTCLNI